MVLIFFFNFLFYLADHVSHLVNAEEKQLNTLLGLLFDLDNIAVTIDNEAKNPEMKRDHVLEELYNSIYYVIIYNNYYLFDLL